MPGDGFPFRYPALHEPCNSPSGDPMGILAIAKHLKVPNTAMKSDDSSPQMSQKERESRFIDLVHGLARNGCNAPPDNQEWDATNYEWAFQHESQALLEAKFPLRLRGYQRHSLNRTLFMLFVLEHGALLALDMGLGKTLVVIALCVEVAKRYQTTNRRWTHQPNDWRGLVTPLRGGILIVVPLSVLMHWERQFDDHVKEGHFSVLVYHGNTAKASKSTKTLLKYDVVITTYHTLKSEYNDREKALDEGTRCECPLMDLYWLLFVLDEGHIAANPATETNRSVEAITSHHRVVMTGTPLMNEYNDVQSLMSFLRVRPWSDAHTFKSVSSFYMALTVHTNNHPSIS
jgi:SNF2 family DNA or RNA helicase